MGRKLATSCIYDTVYGGSKNMKGGSPMTTDDMMKLYSPGNWLSIDSRVQNTVEYMKKTFSQSGVEMEFSSELIIRLYWLNTAIHLQGIFY